MDECLKRLGENLGYLAEILPKYCWWGFVNCKNLHHCCVVGLTVGERAHRVSSSLGESWSRFVICPFPFNFNFLGFSICMLIPIWN